MAVGINYNFNNSISRPQFRGQQTNPQIVPQAKKEGMSDGAKWGVGLGLTALGAIGLYAVSKGRAGSKSAKQIAKHIEFKEAKTIDEAINWGKENLGITKYEKFDNLEVLNWINKGITDLQNKIPSKKSLFSKISFKSDCSKTWFASYGTSNDLILNKNILNNVDDLLLKDIEANIKNGLFINSNNSLKLANSYQNIDKIKDIEALLDKCYKDTHNLTFSEKIKVHECINKLMFIDNKAKILSMNEKNAILNSINPHHTIFHEAGHMLHEKDIGCRLFAKMMKLEEMKHLSPEKKLITEEFLNTKSIQETAGKVSDYAKESPLEFVAETFAGLVEGKKFSDDVMALYKKYGGPALA